MDKDSSSNSSSRRPSSRASRAPSPPLRGNPVWELEPLEETLVNPRDPEVDQVALRVLRRADEWKAFRAALRCRASRALTASLAALAENKEQTALALLAVVAEYRELISWADKKPPIPETVEVKGMPTK